MCGLLGWALGAVLSAADFTLHASKTVRGALFALLRDAWQTRPAMHVSPAVLGNVKADLFYLAVILHPPAAALGVCIPVDNVIMQGAQ